MKSFNLNPSRILRFILYNNFKPFPNFCLIKMTNLSCIIVLYKLSINHLFFIPLIYLIFCIIDNYKYLYFRKIGLLI